MVNIPPTVRTKMSDLIDSNYQLLSVLSRMGISGTLGEKSIQEFCEDNALDPDTFLLMCNVYSNPTFKPNRQVLAKCHLQDILRYLHHSHDYYLHRDLVDLAATLQDLMKPCSEASSRIVRKFFDDYAQELRKHFSYEEEQVIPYVQALMVGKNTEGFTIDQFEENHTNVEESLSDFRNILLKSLPPECDPLKKYTLIHNLYELQMDLASHTSIEDNILVPLVRYMEHPRSNAPSQTPETAAADDSQNELSEREKEILVSVAQGLLNKEIADRHNISINTVITHRKNITRKTGIKTVAGLTVYAILNGLIDINSVE